MIINIIVMTFFFLLHPHPSIHPSIHPPIHPPIYHPPIIHQPTHQPTHSSTHPPDSTPAHPSIHPPPPTHPPVHPHTHPSARPPTHPPNHISIHPFIHTVKSSSSSPPLNHDYFRCRGSVRDSSINHVSFYLSIAVLVLLLSSISLRLVERCGGTTGCGVKSTSLRKLSCQLSAD